jgi:hypothetical protein
MAVEEYKEKEEGFMYMKIRKEDICEFLSYNNRIKKRLTENKSVPVKFYDKMMNFIVPKDIDKYNHYDIIVDELAKDIITYFKNHKEHKLYMFSIYEKVIDEDIPNKKSVKNNEVTTRKITQSFEEMIKDAVIVAVGVVIQGNGNKKNILKACYLSITRYVLRNKKIYGKDYHYKSTVIAGYITLKFGHDLSSNSLILKNFTPLYSRLQNSVFIESPVFFINAKTLYKCPIYLASVDMPCPLSPIRYTYLNSSSNTGTIKSKFIVLIPKAYCFTIFTASSASIDVGIIFF